MVNATRVALAWVTTIIATFALIVVYVLLSPQIDMWGEALTHFLSGFSKIEYETAISWVNLSWRVCGIIILVGLYVWSIVTSLSDEFQSDYGGM